MTPPTDRGLLSFVSDQIFELNILKKEETDMADEDLAANDPAPVNDVEKRTDPEDDTGVVQNLGYRGSLSAPQDATVRY